MTVEAEFSILSISYSIESQLIVAQNKKKIKIIRYLLQGDLIF
jgi:hypothetical protein